MTFLYLFWEFFKIGLFAVGGGPATIPFLFDLANSDYGWFTQKQLVDMIAVSESTPGPIGINMATYAGYNAGHSVMGLAGGVLGGIIATAGLVIPSIIVIIIVAGFLKAFSENKYVKSAFYGIRPMVTSLVLFAVYGIVFQTFYQDGAFAWQVIIISLIAFALMFIKKLKKLHPAFWLVLGAVAGVILKL